jgi:hypothetical protein
VRAGRVYTKVSIITLIYFAFVINLSTLEIRRALIKVVDAPKFDCIVSEITLDIIETITIVKSKMLPESLM